MPAATQLPCRYIPCWEPQKWNASVRDVKIALQVYADGDVAYIREYKGNCCKLSFLLPSLFLLPVSLMILHLPSSA